MSANFPLSPVEFCLVIELSRFPVCSRQTCSLVRILQTFFFNLVCFFTFVFVEERRCLILVKPTWWIFLLSGGPGGFIAALITWLVPGSALAPLCSWCVQCTVISSLPPGAPAHLAVSSPFGVCPSAAPPTAPPGRLALCMPGLFPGFRVFGALFYSLSQIALPFNSFSAGQEVRL